MARVRTGLERLLTGRTGSGASRLGLVVNPSSITPDLEHASSPEGAGAGSSSAAYSARARHRRRSEDLVEVATPATARPGLPVHSLYGGDPRAHPAMLAGGRRMVFDVQDVGCRYYTFIYTMLHVMEACARERKRVVVLDRPNPIGGDVVDGNRAGPEYRSFVGMHPSRCATG